MVRAEGQYYSHYPSAWRFRSHQPDSPLSGSATIFQVGISLLRMPGGLVVARLGITCFDLAACRFARSRAPLLLD